MKHSLLFGLILTFVLTSIVSYSQDTIRYSYDNAGNRIGRTIILDGGGGGSLKSGTIKQNLQDDSFKNLTIKIYPNPSRGIIEVEIPVDPDNPEIVRLLVYDMNGKVIIDKPQESDRTILDLSSYQNGLYILNLKKGNTVSKWKIIKQ